MRKFFFITLIIALIFGCKEQSNRDFIQLKGFTQGTTYAITYFDKENRNFLEPIEGILESIDSSMSLYRDNSVISEFNRSQTGIVIDTLLAKVINLSLKISDETDGAFDITIGPLVKAWGFHMKRGEMPDQEIIDDLLKYAGHNMIELKSLSLSKAFPEVIIDVNAIAQGYTVDVLADFLESNGVTNYLVELGGEVRTLGKSPRGKRWLVGVDKPEDNAIPGENFQVIISLSGESLVTSGNYRKFFVKDGRKYSHTIDPETGYPVNHSLLSATVIDRTAARADALATAFMVMGLERAKQWLALHPEVEAYLIFSDEQGDYQVWMSDKMSERVVD